MIYSLILLSCFFVGIPNASINSSFLRLNQLTCEIPSMLSSNFPSVFCLREQTALSVLKCRLNSREYSSPLMETSLNVHSFLMTTSPKCRVSRRAIWDNLYYLILYTVFFVIGYQQGAAVEDDGRDDRAMEFLLRIQVPALPHRWFLYGSFCCPLDSV